MSDRAEAAALTGGGLLARNTLWSLLGQAVPMLAAVVAIPVLLRALGTDAFGILTLSWTLIGYFTLFDLGVGRALTRVVAEGLGGGRAHELPPVVGTALLLLLAIGAAGALVLGAAAPWVAERLLRVPPSLVGEARLTVVVLAASLPAVLVTAGLGGVLAAHQRFRALNLIRIPLSLLSFLLPMAVLPYTHRLAAVVGTIAVVRYLGVLAHLGACLAAMPALRRSFRWAPGLAGPLLRSGGWIAAVNALMPLYSSADRVLVGAWGSVAAVAWYATPQEVATKLWMFPGTLVSVLFPAFASTQRADPARARMLYLRGLRQVHATLFPLALALVVFAGDLLRAWLGAAFEQHGAETMRWLVVGAFCTALSFLPSALLQAADRPRTVGILLLAELPLLAAGLWWGVHAAGTTGAAMAWCVRALVDLAALLALAATCLPEGGRLLRSLAWPALGTLAALLAAFPVSALGLGPRLACLGLVLVPFSAWALARGLADERRALLAALRRRA